MSISTTRNMEREQARRFVRYWDRRLEIVPETRRGAVRAAGETVKQALDGQIQRADLSGIETKGRVKSWQELRLGSGGGWAAVSARKETVYYRDKRASFGARVRQHTWHGGPVTARQVTGWLERGHGTGTGGYVAGRQFYACTRDDAQRIALKAADRVLCRIADEVEFGWEH